MTDRGSKSRNISDESWLGRESFFVAVLTNHRGKRRMMCLTFRICGMLLITSHGNSYTTAASCPAVVLWSPWVKEDDRPADQPDSQERIFGEECAVPPGWLAGYCCHGHATPSIIPTICVRRCVGDGRSRTGPGVVGGSAGPPAALIEYAR
jgi:hypothetical protein